MKIVIDGRMLYWTGVGRYTKALLDNLAEIDSANEYVVLVRREDWAKWEPAAPNFTRMEVNINPYTPAEQLRLPGLLRKLRPDLVHFTAPNSPLLYRGRRVVSIHDLTLVDFDTSRGQGLVRWLRGAKRLPFRLVMWNAAKFADGILTLTDYVKKELVGRYKVTPGKVSVAMPAADFRAVQEEPLDRFGITGDSLLYVGNYFPYKNVGLLLEALAVMVKERPGLKLVLAGKPDYFSEQLAGQARKLGITDNVVFTGFVTDGELVGLYKRAALYLNPSLSEGFGLQGLEAMQYGLPVLAARATCLPEVYGDAAVYFDPHDADDLAAKIRTTLGDPKLREKLTSAGHERVKQFSWRQMAVDTLEAYRGAARP